MGSPHKSMQKRLRLIRNGQKKEGFGANMCDQPIKIVVGWYKIKTTKIIWRQNFVLLKRVFKSCV